MSFDNLKNIYHFVENSHKEEYWKDIFSSNNGNEKNFFNNNLPPIKNSDYFPSCDYYLKNDIYYIEIELPGINPNDLTIKIKDHILYIEGYYQTLHDGCTYLVKERQHKRFTKKLSIPISITEHDIHKKMTNGLFQISFHAK